MNFFSGFVDGTGLLQVKERLLTPPTVSRWIVAAIKRYALAMRYLGDPAAFDAAKSDTLFPLAFTAGLVTALIELPISQYYSTTPRTNTATRMAVAGGMAFVAVLAAGAVVRLTRS